MENENCDRILYQLTVEDFQNVSQEVLDRDLTEAELNLLENKIGDYIDWYGAIESCINDKVDS